MHSIDSDGECFRIDFDVWSAGITDHITFADLADIPDREHLPLEPQALCDTGGVRRARHERNAVPRQRIAKCAEHWAVVNRLGGRQRRIRIAHKAPADLAILYNEFGLGTKEGRFP